MPKKEELKQVQIYVPDPEVRAEIQKEIDDGCVHFAISPAERAVLKKMLDRDRTSREVHGGLKSLFVLSEEEAQALLGFLDRI